MQCNCNVVFCFITLFLWFCFSILKSLVLKYRGKAVSPKAHNTKLLSPHPPTTALSVTRLLTHTHHMTTWRSKPDCDEVSAALPRETGSICACISCHNRKRGTAPPDKLLRVCSRMRLYACVVVWVCVCVGEHFVPDKHITSIQTYKLKIPCSRTHIIYRPPHAACSTADCMDWIDIIGHPWYYILFRWKTHIRTLHWLNFQN